MSLSESLTAIMWHRRTVTFVAFFSFFFGCLAMGRRGGALIYVVLSVCMQHEFAAMAGAGHGSFLLPLPFLHAVMMLNDGPSALMAFPVLALIASAVATVAWKRSLAQFALLFLGAMWGSYLLSFSLLLFLSTGATPYATGVLITLTELSDANQYLFGRLCGRTHVCGSVSPNKTLEGFVGGVLVTVGLAVRLGEPWTYGLGIGVLGIAGDLCMSLLKRRLGLKNTSSLLPGHGGMLDRLDSLLFTAPFGYWFYWYIGHTTRSITE